MCKTPIHKRKVSIRTCKTLIHKRKVSIRTCKTLIHKRKVSIRTCRKFGKGADYLLIIGEMIVTEIIIAGSNSTNEIDGWYSPEWSIVRRPDRWGQSAW